MLTKSTQLPIFGPCFSTMRTILLVLKSLLVFLWGTWRYSQTRHTPESAYQSMIWLFCTTQGKFNDLISKLLAIWRPKVDLPSTHGVLGKMEHQHVDLLVNRLRNDGFIIFPNQLPTDMCDRLLNFATSTPAAVRPMDHEEKLCEPRLALFNPEKPLAVRYDFNTNDLLAQSDVQALLADVSLIKVIQEYLGCQPSADVLSMWWHTSFHDRPDAEAAQFFHFDMDRIKWLKVFIYLTDVGTTNGPHSFVRGSHRSGSIPYNILRRGYVRLSDEEIAENFPKDDILSFTAPRGSIIIEDTRGLHKGVNVQGTPRLILQLQFSNSLFGTNYPPAKLGDIKSSKLKELIKHAPDIYRQYT